MHTIESHARAIVAQSFTYQGTFMQVEQAVEWYFVQPEKGDGFYRIRNHTTGAEIKVMSFEELELIARVILNLDVVESLPHSEVKSKILPSSPI